MSHRRYNGYQGRATAWDVLKFVLGLLAIVLVLALVGLAIGQRYLVYTDDGVHLELPFFQREELPPVDESTPVDIVQLPPAPKPQPAPQPEEGQTAPGETQEIPSEYSPG